MAYSSIRQDIDSAPKPQQGNWYGTFAAAVTDIANMAYVILPDYDENIIWGPCRWQSRDEISLPAKGDECLVEFDNRNQPWVVAWWPFS